MRYSIHRGVACPHSQRWSAPENRRPRASRTRAQPPEWPAWDQQQFPSLVPETLEELSSDEELTKLHADVLERGQLALTKEEDKIRLRALDKLGVASFEETCSQAGVAPLRRSSAKIFQLNIGLYCTHWNARFVFFMALTCASHVPR